MTDFEKLMDLLKVLQEDREKFLQQLVLKNIELVLDFHEDGLISWGTLGDFEDEDE